MHTLYSTVTVALVIEATVVMPPDAMDDVSMYFKHGPGASVLFLPVLLPVLSTE